MKKHEDFSNSSLNPEEEKTYLDKIFQRYYAHEYKKKYAAILEDKYQVVRIEDNHKPGNRTKTFKLLKYGIGIAACFLVFIFSWQFIGGNGHNFDELVSTYSSNDILQNREIKRGESMNDVFRTEAIQLYNEGKYQDALNSYASVKEVNSEDKFWMAMASFYDKDYVRSEASFQDLLLTEDLKFRNELNWYYALSLLHNGKKSEAKVLLKEMQSWKSKEAKELLDALK